MLTICTLVALATSIPNQPIQLTSEGVWITDDVPVPTNVSQIVEKPAPINEPASFDIKSHSFYIKAEVTSNESPIAGLGLGYRYEPNKHALKFGFDISASWKLHGSPRPFFSSDGNYPIIRDINDRLKRDGYYTQSSRVTFVETYNLKLSPLLYCPISEQRPYTMYFGVGIWLTDIVYDCGARFTHRWSFEHNSKTVHIEDLHYLFAAPIVTLGNQFGKYFAQLEGTIYPTDGWGSVQGRFNLPIVELSLGRKF